MGINPHTYDDIKTSSVPHGVGSVWCAMLWDLYLDLVDEHGFSNDIYSGEGGNNIAMQLVIDGLKLQSCNPGFIDGRDAILEADMLNYDGANQCLIWQVFANRGLGASASQGSSSNRFDQTEAFDVPPVYNTDQEFAICEGETIEINGTTYDEAGVYVDTFSTDGGCDSTVTSVVTYFGATDIDVNVNTLTAENDNPGVTYQWINCADNSEIAGETGQQYEATASGEYAVIVTENGCARTSDCIDFTVVGLQDFLRDNVSISPNPTSDIIQVELGEIKDVREIFLKDVQGRKVYSKSAFGLNRFTIDMQNLSDGVYFLNIVSSETTGIFKVVKE